MMSHQELQQQQEAGKEGMEEVAAVGTTERVCYVHCNFCNTVLAVSVPSSSMYTMVTVRCGHCANLLSVNMGGLIIAPPPPQPPAAAAAPSLYPNNNSLLPCSQPNTASTALPLHDHHQVESSLENEKEQVGFEEGLITTTNNNNSSSASSTSGSSKYSSSSSGKQQVVAVSPPLPNGGAAHQPPSPLEYSWVDDHHHHHHEPPRLPPIRPPEKRQRVPSAYNRFIKEEIQRIKASNPEISHREAFSTAAKNWAHFPHIHFGLKLEGNKNKHAKLGDHHHQHHHHFHQQQQQPYGGSAADNNNNNSTGTLLFNNHKKTPNNSSNNNSKQ